MGNWKLSLKNNQLHIRIKNKRSLQKDFQKNQGRMEIYFHTRPKTDLSVLSNMDDFVCASRRWTPPLTGCATPLMRNVPKVNRGNNSPQPIVNSHLPNLDPTATKRPIRITISVMDDGHVYGSTHSHFISPSL